MKLLASSSLTLLALTACSTIPNIIDPAPISSAPIWDGTPPEFCIALSGGGIRSGATSLGVLQGLHEYGLLSRADIISTVSGGGYPVYGLVAAKGHNPALALDDLLDDEQEHIRRAQETVFIDSIDGGFIATMMSLRSIFSLPFRILGPTPDIVEETGGTYVYGLELNETFSGVPFYHTNNFLLKDSQGIADSLGLPYWIIQTSSSDGLRLPRTSHRYKQSHIFELSSNWIGSESHGYMRSYVPSLTLMHAVIASAAAIDTPKHQGVDFASPNFARRIGFGLGAGIHLQDGRRVFLSDGGFIENQAVAPLILRGCGTIFALDAAHDPEVSMDGWEVAKDLVEKNGYEAPKIIFRNDGKSDGAAFDAWNLPSNSFDMVTTNDAGKSIKIAGKKLGVAPLNEATYPEVVRTYFADDATAWAGNPGCNSEKGLAKRCTFPQQATATQNFSPDEFKAYRCLGYHLAREFARSEGTELGATQPVRILAKDCQ